MFWATAAQYGLESLKEDDKGSAALTQHVGGPATFDGGNWTVNFGSKPLDVNALPPWVMGAGLAVAGVVAIAMVRSFAK